MRLLDKKTIDVQVANDRKLQIEEGLAIARKVDALRQTLSTLEIQQKKFVDGMQQELFTATQKLHQEKELLEAQVSGLHEQKKLLLQPLDAQWEVVHTREEELTHKEEECQKKIAIIAEQHVRIEQKLTDEKERLGKIKIRERELERAYMRVGALVQEREKELVIVVKEKENWEKQKAVMASLAIVREQSNEFNRQANENYHQRLQQKELELSERERAINDKYRSMIAAANELRDKQLAATNQL